jgi:signal transduction histidine kinase
MAGKETHAPRERPWPPDAWARRLGAQSYAGTAMGPALALGCVFATALLLLQDVLILPGYSSLPLSLILVAAAGWALGPRSLAVVASAAVAAHAAEVWLSNWGWPIAVIGIMGIGLAAVTSRQAALSRTRQRRLIEQERQVKELTFLLDTTGRLSANLDEKDILQTAVQAAALAVSRQKSRRTLRAAYHELRGDRLVIQVESDQIGTIGFEYPVSRNEAARRTIENSEACVMHPFQLGGQTRDLIQKLGIQALLYAPVIVGERVAGLLVAGHTDSPRVEPQELRLLEVIARTTGLAIGNAELLRREREHARRMEALEKAKSALLKRASHELRGPLTVARGYVSMLFDGSVEFLPGPQANAVSIIQSKLTEMELMVDQMVEASRMEDGSLRLHLQKLDLRHLANEAVCATRPLLGHRGQMTFEQPMREVPALVDRERIVTVIANLLSNAVKYSPELNGVDVRCTVTCLQSRARVSVRDCGLGIAPEDLPHLFSRFGRILTSENSNISGLGLGLYVSRELAREHGGDITVVSSPGRGSEFILELPSAR